MNHQAWTRIKQTKGFYVHTFRRAGNWLAFTCLLNLLLGVAVYYAHKHQDPPHFYATSGVVAPVQLTPMSEPNDTDVPLLAADINSEPEIKVIVQ